MSEAESDYGWSDYDEDDWKPACHTCGGDGSVEEDDWQVEGYGTLVRCWNCKGSGNAEDCWLW